ncbi:hypothetical protein K7X08_006664 [Anisodus acutangulus]|uniref:F-box associated domain-containing protein n=1 Tax=Anisodus acutangulus TaxID=402998 RepID=A0A9Q1RP31_9SOLA|nr:hypothetical protein K7X08_006664 [Anisodus acutangulus]
MASILELKADYDYYSCPRNRPIELSHKFSPPSTGMEYVFNRFIYLLNGKTHDEYHSVYINNPLLCEYFKLKLPECEKNVIRVAYGLCFSEASGQYKVLRLVVRKLQDHLEVSELEVYVNAALHWMGQRKDDCIYSFDIGTEKLKSLPAPPGLETPSWCLTLTVLGNCLCLADYIYGQRVDIWRMKEYEIAESWTKDSVLVYSIPLGMRRYKLEAILI